MAALTTETFRLPQVANSIQFRYTLTSVPAVTRSVRCPLDVGLSNGVLGAVSISYPNTTVTTVDLFSSNTGLVLGPDHIFRAIEVTCRDKFPLFGCAFRNGDPAPSPGCENQLLYVEIENLGAGTDTGIVTLELTVNGTGAI